MAVGRVILGHYRVAAGLGQGGDIEHGQVQTQSFSYDALDRLTGASAQAGGPWAAYSGSYEYDVVGNLRLKAEGGITHTMQYSDTAHVHAVSAVDGAVQVYDANGNMTMRVIDGVTYAQGWDQENRLVWAGTGGVTTTFTYDANGALVKKEDPLVGATYYVGPHYEVLAPAVILPPAPTDLEACHASGSPPNVCNDLAWSGSSGVTYSVYRSTTSPVPIDAGHRIASGITETNYTDCGNVYNRYYAVTAVNENGESDPSNEDRASEPCGSAMALTLPVLNVTTLTESGEDPVVTKYYFHGGKRVALRRDDVVQYLVGDHLGSTSVVLNANGTVHSEARHYPYGEERWSSGTLPTDYRFTGQRSESGLGLYFMGAREYDPALGHWISPDTLVPEPGSSQSYNRYAYVRNSPLKFVDPTGHMEDGECGPWGEDCTDVPLPYEPSPPPVFYPPFSDSMVGPERHLVESCDPLDCADAMFNPYTPGGWDFRTADDWYVANSQVYNAGPVSWPEARRAAREGGPNPVTSEQMSEGLRMRPNQDFEAEPYLALYIRLWYPYSFFFRELGWEGHEGMNLSNFEPHYLEVLLASHPYELELAYQAVLYAYYANPTAFMAKMNPWAYGSRR